MAPSPFDGAGEGGEGGAPFEAGLPPLDAGPDKTLGGPCLDDGQCDDGVECTQDACDLGLRRCRFSPDDEPCVDDVFCDGRELCEPGLGCREGEPVSCSDNTVCTLDVCVEATRSCEHAPRDADGDGDPVWNCRGTDCDDANPRVNGGTVEVCGNGRDDDCDLERDETDCSSAEHDSCADPLVIESSGSYVLSLAAAAEDVSLPAACVEAEEVGRRDVVAALVVPEGEPTDVDIVVESSVASSLALGAAEICEPWSSLLDCNKSFTRGGVARVVLRELAPGVYPLAVSGTTDADATLRVLYGPALPAPRNETCATASVLMPGVNQQVSLAAPEDDVESACSASGTGEVLYRFDLDAPADVELRAVSLDGYGVPELSLRDTSCVPAGSELTCRASARSTLFARALPAGRYFVAVSARGPSDVDLSLALSAPTTAPADEGCADPPRLELGETREIDLQRRVDAVASPCLPGGADTTFAFALEERSDLLLVERISAGDRGAVALYRPGCRAPANLACNNGSSSPVRTRALAVEPGEYRVVGESELGAPVTLSVLSRPARPATLVAFADGCDDAITIPETGGRFVGNTLNAESDFGASCDFGGSSSGAPDQMLHLRLGERRRVVFDMSGSDYDALLVVRHAGECPGAELQSACAGGIAESASYLDLTLPAGDYLVQIDGYRGAAGAWTLDVFVAEP